MGARAAAEEAAAQAAETWEKAEDEMAAVAETERLASEELEQRMRAESLEEKEKEEQQRAEEEMYESMLRKRREQEEEERQRSEREAKQREAGDIDDADARKKRRAQLEDEDFKSRFKPRTRRAQDEDIARLEVEQVEVDPMKLEKVNDLDLSFKDLMRKTYEIEERYATGIRSRTKDVGFKVRESGHELQTISDRVHNLLNKHDRMTHKFKDLDEEYYYEMASVSRQPYMQ